MSLPPVGCRLCALPVGDNCGAGLIPRLGKAAASLHQGSVAGPQLSNTEDCAPNLRERGQSGTVTRPSTIQCLHYNLLNIVARPPTVLCVYLLSTPNDSGRVVMRLDMVYAPSSINYNLYPPSYIPPSIQNNCKKSQFVTSKITVKSHKM